MADPYLEALVRTVEEGAESPPLWMTLGSGDLVTGVPRPSRDFVEGSFRALIDRYNHSEQLRLRIRNKDERKTEVERLAAAGVEPFNVPVDRSSADLQTLTLSDVTVMWSGRDGGAQIPVIRLNLDSIALWWIAGGREFRGPLELAPSHSL